LDEVELFLRQLVPRGNSGDCAALPRPTRSGRAAGFTTHIGKPVVPEDLVAAVANFAMLTRRRACAPSAALGDDLRDGRPVA